MNTRVVLGTLAILLLLSSAVMALESDKKMGYGFAPGLVPGKDFVAGPLVVGIQEGMETEDHWNTS